MREYLLCCTYVHISKKIGFSFRAILEVRDHTKLSHGSVLVRGHLVGRHLLATNAETDLRISLFPGCRKGYLFSFANWKTTCKHNKDCDAPPQTNWLDQKTKDLRLLPGRWL
jgi:hypothetical protein